MSYPIDYAHSVQLFTQETTAEQRMFVFQHLVRPLRQAFPELDDVAAGTLACQLYPGFCQEPGRLATALAMALGFLLDTHRIQPDRESEAVTKVSSVMHGFIPQWLEHWPAVQLSIH